MKTIFTMLFLTAAMTAANAQYQVNDSALQAITQQGNAAELQKWAESLQKAQSQLDTMNSQLDKIKELRNIAGDPSQALSQLGLGSMGNLDLSSVGKTVGQLQETADSAQSLSNNARGLYKEIPTSLNGVEIPRNLDDYKKFAAVEGGFNNYQQVSQESSSRITSLRRERDNTLKKAASTQAEQAEKQSKLTALNGEIDAEEAKMKNAKDQLDALQIANQNDEAKQRQARSDELIAKEKNMKLVYPPDRKPNFTFGK